MAKKSVSSHENLENFDSQMVLSLSQMVLHAAPPSGPRSSYSPESEKQPAEQPNGNLLQKKRVLQSPQHVGMIQGGFFSLVPP